jgi:hypothetical protein
MNVIAQCCATARSPRLLHANAKAESASVKMKAAVDRIVAVRHLRRDLHGHQRIARSDIEELHAEARRSPGRWPTWRRPMRARPRRIRPALVGLVANLRLAAHARRPVNRAGRFSVKAATPSA